MLVQDINTQKKIPLMQTSLLIQVTYSLKLEIVSPKVYDQLNSTCASGYAFATAAAVESLMYKIFNNLIPLSAQQLVDCSK